MPSRDDIEKYTQMLGLINGFIPVGAQLVFAIADGIKALRGPQDATTVAEAQAALDQFARVTQTTKTQIADWLATHPPEPTP